MHKGCQKTGCGAVHCPESLGLRKWATTPATPPSADLSFFRNYLLFDGPHFMTGQAQLADQVTICHRKIPLETGGDQVDELFGLPIAHVPEDCAGYNVPEVDHNSIQTLVFIAFLFIVACLHCISFCNLKLVI